MPDQKKYDSLRAVEIMGNPIWDRVVKQFRDKVRVLQERRDNAVYGSEEHRELHYGARYYKQCLDDIENMLTNVKEGH